MPEASDTGLAEGILLDAIPSLQRLALAYAPVRARPATLALFALDSRLAGLVRGSSEALLAQIRLAWWRDRLSDDNSSGPKGEPVLAALRAAGFELPALVPLVDGWEAMTAEPPLEPSACMALAEGRGLAFAALGDVLGQGAWHDAALSRGKAWALIDLAERLGDSREREMVTRLAGTGDSAAPLPRALQPLAVLHGVARRQLRRGATGPGLSPGDLLAAIRLGIAGR